jgi:hypothetical protein
MHSEWVVFPQAITPFGAQLGMSGGEGGEGGEGRGIRWRRKRKSAEGGRREGGGKMYLYKAR